jgi:hypothetical protein
MKKLLNFIGLGVDPAGAFLRDMRRAQTGAELFTVCDAFLIRDGLAEAPFATEPHANLLARPNHEGPEGGCGL